MVREHTVNSSFTAQHLRSIRPRAAVTVLGLLDLVDEQDAQPAASPAELLFVGRLIDDKRAELVPAVVAKARESIPGLIGIVVGDGPRRERLERAVTASPARGAVQVLGRIDDAGLRRRRARAAVLFAPSVREGFGLAVAESAAAGVPVVVARHPDNASVDLVEPGVNGELTRKF